MTFSKFLLAFAMTLFVTFQSFGQCSAGTDLISNGDFETGDFTDWIPMDIGTPFIPLQVICASGISAGFGFDPIDPIDGSCMAYNGFDGDGPGQITLHQEISIPDGKTTALFSWSENIAYDLLSFGATLDRMFEVQVQPEGGGAPLAILYSMDAEAGTIETGTGWVSHTVDISEFAGQTVRLCFVENIPEFFTGPAQIGIDGVSVDCVSIVPTLGEWAVIILFLVMTIFGSLAIKSSRPIAIA